MHKHALPAIVLTVLALLIVSVSSPGKAALAQKENKDGLPPGKAAALAQDVVERLYRAVEARDLDGVMKLVDVPFCVDGRDIIKDRVKLCKFFEKSLGRVKAGTKFKIHIRKVAPMLDYIENKKAPPSRGADLSAFLTRNHRVVFVETERPDPPGGFQPAWIGVNIENGTAKVVGIVD